MLIFRGGFQTNPKYSALLSTVIGREDHAKIYTAKLSIDTWKLAMLERKDLFPTGDFQISSESMKEIPGRTWNAIPVSK